MAWEIAEPNYDGFLWGFAKNCVFEEEPATRNNKEMKKPHFQMYRKEY